MKELAFKALMEGLTGQLGLTALLVYWTEALLALLGLFVVIEGLLVWRRVRIGETMWSAVSKWGDRRIYRHRDQEEGMNIREEGSDEKGTVQGSDAAQPHQAPEAVVDDGEEISQHTEPTPAESAPPIGAAPIVDPPAPPVTLPATLETQAPVALLAADTAEAVRPSQVLTQVPTPTTVNPAPQPPSAQSRFDVDATADMVEEMYLVKSGFLRVLWEQRKVEETAGNVVGMRTVDVLISEIENMAVQRVWVLGSTKLKMSAG